MIIMSNKIIFITFILIASSLFLVRGQTSHHTFQVNLTINNTVNQVYIPGIGIVSSGGITSSTFTEPDHFYLTSYLNNNMKSLIFSQQNPISMSVKDNDSHHFFSVDQNLSNSQVFLVFTKGSNDNIQNRMELIESGKFMKEISPSFSYGLGTLNPINLVIDYSDIDIYGNLTLRKGVHEITLESNKTSTQKILIINETFG